MTARFANMMIETLWTSNSIDHVQITAAEAVDVGTRGSFYDATGALRDMVPNHLFQLLAMVAMEPPASFDAEAIRNEKAQGAEGGPRLHPRRRAQERRARRATPPAGSATATSPATTTTPDVAADSRTETFVALRLMVDTWRWAGVPFYLRTGKAMAVRDTEIVVTFKPVPFAQFNKTAAERLPPNRLVIQLQPGEGLSMEILIKRPGLGVDTVPVTLDFNYADRFDVGHLPGINRCSTTCSSATRPCSSAPMRSRRAGRRCSPSSTYGRRTALRSLMPRAAWGRPAPMRCSRATATAGTNSRPHRRSADPSSRTTDGE